MCDMPAGRPAWPADAHPEVAAQWTKEGLAKMSDRYIFTALLFHDLIDASLFGLIQDEINARGGIYAVRDAALGEAIDHFRR